MLDHQSLTMAQILSRREKFQFTPGARGCCRARPCVKRSQADCVFELLLSGLREVGAKVLTPIGGAPRHRWRAVRIVAHVSAHGYEWHHQE
jgi:hypothetical protein